MSQNLTNDDSTVEIQYTNPLLGQSFESIEASRRALDDLGFEVGFCMRVRDYRPSQRDATYVVYECTKSRQVGCRYQIALKLGSEGWMFSPVNSPSRDCHNHAFLDVTNTSKYRQRLLENKREDIVAMWKSGNNSSMIVDTLRAESAEFSCINPQDIFTILHAHKRTQGETQHPLEWLSQQLDNNASFWLRIRTEQERLTGLFIAPTANMELLRKYPKVVAMDTTTKKTRFETPVFNICGKTTDDAPFQIAACFLVGGAESDYSWALECLGQLYSDINVPPPQISCTNNDSSLVQALQTSPILENVPHILCSGDFRTVLRSMTRHFFPTTDSRADHPQFKSFLQASKKLIKSGTEDEYERNYAALSGAAYPTEAVEYVRDNWIIPSKKKIVACYIDKHTHFGHTKTSFESYANFRDLLTCHSGDLGHVLGNVTSFWSRQATQVEQQQRDSKGKMAKSAQSPLFEQIRDYVAGRALKIMAKELQKVNLKMKSSSSCHECPISKAYGLPCFHILHEHLKSQISLPPSLIDPYWFGERIPISGQNMRMFVNPTKVRGKGRPRGALAAQRPSKRARKSTQGGQATTNRTQEQTVALTTTTSPAAPAPADTTQDESDDDWLDLV